MLKDFGLYRFSQENELDMIDRYISQIETKIYGRGIYRLWQDFRSKNIQVKIINSQTTITVKPLKERTCRVCYDNEIQIVFLPCGHFVTCKDCAQKVRKCVVCRTTIKGIIRAYES